MSENITHVPAEQRDEERRRRRGAVARFGLAGVAVLGLGAAATSAAWTDDAWFAGSASAAEVELQGSIDGATWIDADTSGTGIAVEVPDTAFADLNEATQASVDLHLRNDGSVPLTLGSASVTTDDTGIFGGTTPATVSVTDPAVTTLGPGDTTSVTLQVSTPDGWDASYQGQTGSLTVQFTGQS